MEHPLVFFFLEMSFNVEPFIFGVGTEEKASCGTPGGEEGGGAGFRDLSVENLKCGWEYV